MFTAYPASFDDDYDEEAIFDAVEPKLTRPLSVPGSPRDRSGMMTPGDFASLQEGREGLSTEDYISWKLPYVTNILNFDNIPTNLCASREEEDPDEYPFPLTLRNQKKSLGPNSPVDGLLNGGS